MEGDKIARGRIRQKESAYRRLYSTLLRKRRGALQRHQHHQHHKEDGQSGANNNDAKNISVAAAKVVPSSEDDDFAEEEDALNRIFRAEVQNLLIGVAATALVWTSLRFGTRYAFSSGLFGIDKAVAMAEAERQAKRRGTETFQKTFGTLRKCRTILIVTTLVCP
jgi:hypothetical protein